MRDAGLHVLVADDYEPMRVLLATALLGTVAVASVVEAVDGAEAVELGRAHRLDVAVLDLNMPQLSGLEAASRLRDLQPSLRIALVSSETELLRDRAGALGLPRFDKIDLDGLFDWVERQAESRYASDAPGRPLGAVARADSR